LQDYGLSSAWPLRTVNHKTDRNIFSDFPLHENLEESYSLIKVWDIKHTTPYRSGFRGMILILAEIKFCIDFMIVEEK
jgi:hypothetical protein